MIADIEAEFQARIDRAMEMTDQEERVVNALDALAFLCTESWLNHAAAEIARCTEKITGTAEG